MYTWNKERNIRCEIEYLDGMKHGFYKSYFTDNGITYENIESYQNDLLLEIIKMEW